MHINYNESKLRETWKTSNLNIISIDKKMALHILSSYNLKELLSMASCLNEKGHDKIVTYSRKIFLPITNLCSNDCAYCGYKKEPNDGGGYLDERSALTLIKSGVALGCTEALIMSGERPETKYPEARKFLKNMGFNSTVDYACYIAELALENGLLPHINIGLLTKDEMAKLKKCAVSIGLMLESTSLELLKKGGPHYLSPSKSPARRIKMMEDAGELHVPFTTGILVGIGEKLEDIIDSLFLFKYLSEKYGNIQEVIIQPFRPEKGTPMESFSEPSLELLQRTIATARLILGPGMNIQSPPNLTDCESIIMAGANDLGGISPLTIDYVNPSFRWPDAETLQKKCKSIGYELKRRLPVYPEFIEKQGFLDERLLQLIKGVRV